MAKHPAHADNGVSVNIRVSFQEFKIPPVQDALVLGKEASIGVEAMRHSLTLLHVEPFDHIELSGDNEDDVIGDILVRRSVLSKVPQEKLARLVVDRLKPFMGPQEILQLRINAEVSLEHQL